MTVNVSKPAINVREKLAELDKPTGIAGEAMLRAETPQEQFNLIGAGRRNLAINGDFQVWQRGTSFSANRYTADRVYSQSDGNTQTFERVQDAVGVYHLKATRTSASALYNNIVFSVENGINIASDKFISFSFWAKGSVPVEVEVNFRRSSTGAGGTSLVNDGVSEASTDHYIGAEWTYVTQTVKLRDTFQATDVHLLAQIGIVNLPLNEYLEVKEVQLELGKVATPFEHRSYGEELAACQRYFERRGTDVANWEFISDAGQLTSATNYQCAIRFNEQMRAPPTMSVTGTVSDLKVIRASVVINVTGITASDNANGRTLLLYGTCASSGGAAGEQTRIQTAVPGTWVNFDAEL